MSGDRTLIVLDRDGVRWIRLNRPERLNALDRALLTDLLAVVEESCSARGIAALVLTGNGRAFCAGGDLRAGLQEVTGSGSLVEQGSVLRNFTRIVELLVSADKPLVGAINGPCAGAGLSLACAADIRIASSQARFATSFVSAGVSGDFGGTWSLSNIVGAGRAKELYLTGRTIEAREALDIGLVSQVCDPSDLDNVAAELARKLARLPALAVAAVRANFAELPASLNLVLDRETARHVACANSNDAAEAASAFRERRQAVFST